MTKTALFVLYEDVQLLDVSGPAAVLTMVNTVLGEEVYKLQYVSASKDGSVLTNNKMRVLTDSLPEDENIDLLIVPGALDDAIDKALQDKKLISWLNSISEKIGAKVSVCTGAFFFAELGWLNNKKVTTHWASAKKLSKLYPYNQSYARFALSS